MSEYLYIGRTAVSVIGLRSCTEEEAVEALHTLPKTEVIRVWKMANKKTEPKPRESEKKKGNPEPDTEE